MKSNGKLVGNMQKHEISGNVGYLQSIHSINQHKTCDVALCCSGLDNNSTAVWKTHSLPKTYWSSGRWFQSKSWWLNQQIISNDVTLGPLKLWTICIHYIYYKYYKWSGAGFIALHKSGPRASNSTLGLSASHRWEHKNQRGMGPI